MDEMKQQVATMIRHFRAQNHPASLWLTNALDEMNKEVKPAWVANCPHCGVECEEFGHEYTAQMSATWGCVDGAVEVINTEELSDSGGYDHCFECGQTIQVNLLEWRAKG